MQPLEKPGKFPGGVKMKALNGSVPHGSSKGILDSWEPNCVTAVIDGSDTPLGMVLHAEQVLLLSSSAIFVVGKGLPQRKACPWLHMHCMLGIIHPTLKWTSSAVVRARRLR